MSGHWRNSLRPTYDQIEKIVKSYETFVTGVKGKEQDKNPDRRYDLDLEPKVEDPIVQQDTPRWRQTGLEIELKDYREKNPDKGDDSPIIQTILKEIDTMKTQFGQRVGDLRNREPRRTSGSTDEEVYQMWLEDRRDQRRSKGVHDCPPEILEHRRKLIEVRNEIVSYMEREQKKLGKKTRKPVNLIHPTPYHGNGKFGGK